MYFSIFYSNLLFLRTILYYFESVITFKKRTFSKSPSWFIFFKQILTNPKQGFRNYFHTILYSTVYRHHVYSWVYISLWKGDKRRSYCFFSLKILCFIRDIWIITTRKWQKQFLAADIEFMFSLICINLPIFWFTKWINLHNYLND